MSSPKDQNNEVDLSKFFERKKNEPLAPTIIKPVDFKLGNRKKQTSLIWIVVVNFIIGTAIFSYYIIKSRVAASIEPVTMQKLTAPVNYPEELRGNYMPPLP